MDFASAVSTAAGFLVKHLDILSLVIDLIENKGMDKAALVKALNEAATESSDLVMEKEFPNA